MARVEVLVDGVTILDGNWLHALRVVTAVRRLDLVDDQVATLQLAVRRPGERGRPRTASPVVVDGNLAAALADLADRGAPGVIVFDARPGNLDHFRECAVDELRALGQKRNLLGALYLAHALQLIGEVDPLDIGKCLDEGIHEPIEHHPFGRAHVALEPHDADALVRQGHLAQLLNGRLPVCATRFTQVGYPVLHVAPLFGARRDRGDLSAERKDAGDVRVTPSAAMGEVAGFCLEVGRVPRVVRRDQTVQVLPLEQLAHGRPAAVPLGE